MTRVYSAHGYTMRINNYFKTIKGKYHMELLPGKSFKDKENLSQQKVWDIEPEPPTLSGLALYLGFTSRNEFEAYEQQGEFAGHVKKARLRIEAEYEKKLHSSPATGAIFVLRSMGWSERADGSLPNTIPKKIQIDVMGTGYECAPSEQNVVLI